jgi:hypothetical protein
MDERSRAGREGIVGDRATPHADAEARDLEFWQRQTPEGRYGDAPRMGSHSTT